jgi:hypothetical protein
MKKQLFETVEFEKRFQNEKLEEKQLNYLRGGDGDGSEPGISPWPKP